MGYKGLKSMTASFPDFAWHGNISLGSVFLVETSAVSFEKRQAGQIVGEKLQKIYKWAPKSQHQSMPGRPLSLKHLPLFNVPFRTSFRMLI